MELQYLDGAVFLEALRDTTEQLRINREKLNQINVFPVPDGDTGNNLLHTFESALQEAQQADHAVLGSVVKAASRGAQNGSCGSSGAIFAQFLNGWAVILSHLDRAGVESLVKALKEGAKKAYMAVVRPVEGTILTVARKAAEGAQTASAGGDMAEILLAVYHQGLKALNQTPRMLEALGSRGVVDAGGWGLLLFFSSLLKAMHVQVDRGRLTFDPIVAAVGKADKFGFEHAYDLEFSFNCSGTAVGKRIRELLNKCGSELITRVSPEHCHVHIHTDRPAVVVERASSLAPLQDLIIRDMKTQFRNMKEPPGAEERNHTVIALGESPGFLALFALAGAEAAVSLSSSRRVSLLQEEFRESGALILTSGRESSLTAFIPVLHLGEEARVLAALLSLHSTCTLSLDAVRRAAGYPRLADITVEGHIYKACNRETVIAAGKFREVLYRAVTSLEPEAGELLSLFYGRRVKRSFMEKFVAPVQKLFPEVEVEIYYGGQDYPLVVSVE